MVAQPAGKSRAVIRQAGATPHGAGVKYATIVLATASANRTTTQRTGESSPLGAVFRLTQMASRNAPRQKAVASGALTYQSSERHSDSHSDRAAAGARREAARRRVR